MNKTEADWTLAECRRKIDGIDLELRDLLNRRAAIVEDVVRAKEALGMPIYEPKREQDVVRRVAEGNPGPLPSDAFQRIFEAIMTEMRQLQSVYLERKRIPE